ncbi:hypothetical protein Lesp02_10380 [Lentzea sp. NBRC 105346]|uniref:NAD-dependent protein deacetylase of SIR2 family n=1 Tax=Lentzea sp. NBRC 105346 TaxID=3032205 RepID=UPI0024A0886D|nr:NAD-dependent protein deacetylase of SIR2 family [Lentzea sp. NBRC 105346]GLZ28848.1 hypothetical protein Lesp02_10380 [Lentzea sp. NBRC 105346]
MIEIACDESGSEGTNLVGGVTDVFAHASVGISRSVAEDCVRRIRDWIRSPAVEYKANHLLREKNRAVLEWFLGPRSPIHGNAFVHLVDKALFLERHGASDPLYPAILRAVELWPGQVSIIHDRQRALTDERIAALRSRSPRLAGITLVAARADARIQVADFLAGVARRIASDALNGRPDPVLTELLLPHVDKSSIWHAVGFA